MNGKNSTGTGFLWDRLGEVVSRLMADKKNEELKKKFKRIFSDASLSKMIDRLDESGLKTFAGEYHRGVPMATPVFDGAKEDEIKALLKEAGLPTSAQATRRAVGWIRRDTDSSRVSSTMCHTGLAAAVPRPGDSSTPTGRSTVAPV